MKQNSRILFHHMRKSLIKSCLGKSIWILILVSFFALRAASSKADEKPANLASFDPAKGFKPAQNDLTEVFLQIAGSLEFYGSPEPYLLHTKAEHARIEAKYEQQLRTKPRSFCPAYMDDAYFEHFAANWKHIAPQLGLETLLKNTGHLMRLAIIGADGKGTMLVDVFKRHQRAVEEAMTSNKPVQIPDFESLKADVAKILKFDQTPSQIGDSTAQQQSAINPAKEARAAFDNVFAALDRGLAAADAEKVKAVILSLVTDVGRMAQSEVEAAKLEESLGYRRSLQGPYSAETETALNAEELKTFASFMKMTRFTKADFPALDKFYGGPYDRLTERGKDEMSKRIDAGMRPKR